MGEVSIGSVVGRYTIYEEIAAGGMATVHYGRLMGPVGFSRPVAIKRLHAHLAKDPEFVTMFLDEARVAARIRHPNVVATLDIVTTDKQLFLVMEYVEGETIARLLRKAKTRNSRLPVGVSCSIMVGALHGLHAAHTATSERSEPLGIIHRDVSPQNIMVGLDGVARVLDFGVAKAIGRLQTTREGQLKGKLAYMAPEYFTNAPITQSVDIYAASVVAWELLAGTRLYPPDAVEATLMGQILHGTIAPPSKHNPDVTAALDAIVLRGLSRDPAQRYATAREMARELEQTSMTAATSSVGEWVESLAEETLQERAKRVAEIESSDVFDRGSLPDDVDLSRPLGGKPAEAQLKPGTLVVAALPGPDQMTDVMTDLFNAEHATPAPARPRRTFWFAAGGVLVAIALALVVGRPSTHASTANPEPPVLASLPSSLAPPPSAEVPPVATSVVATAASSAPTTRVAPPVRPTSTAKKGCNPPYIFVDGVKKYKVDCL